MHLSKDYEHPRPHGGRCRVRLYTETTELPVILYTELPDNEGMSITNAAEIIAAEVMENHPDILDPFAIAQIPGVSYDKPFVWVEQYQDEARGTPQDPATFDLVSFSHYEPRQVLRTGDWRKEIGEPSWTALDRASVEALIGQEVED